MPAQAGIHFKGWQDHGLDFLCAGMTCLFRNIISLMKQSEV